jgi:predicted transcriptional regulator
MIHRGKILAKAIEETKTSKVELAKYLRVTRPTLDTYIRTQLLNLDVLLSAGKFMRYDFSREIPELSTAEQKREAEENLNFKFKYFELLEKYTHLLEEKEASIKKKRAS